MEQTLMDIVNLGIGAAKTAGTSGQEFYSKFQGQINDWIAQGEAASDENSVKVKSAIEKAIANYSEIEGQAKSLLEDVVSRFQSGETVESQAAAV